MTDFTDREVLEMIYSDAHKDAFGHRPRGVDLSEVSDEQLLEAIDGFSVRICADEALDRAAEELAMLALHHPRGVVEFTEYAREWGKNNGWTEARTIQEFAAMGWAWGWIIPEPRKVELESPLAAALRQVGAA